MGLLAELLQVDPAGLSADEAVTFAQQVERARARRRVVEIAGEAAPSPSPRCARVPSLSRRGGRGCGKDALGRAAAAVHVEGDGVEAELDLPRSEALSLAPGERVHVSPRRARVFPAREGDADSLTSSAL